MRSPSTLNTPPRPSPDLCDSSARRPAPSLRQSPPTLHVEQTRRVPASGCAPYRRSVSIGRLDYGRRRPCVASRVRIGIIHSSVFEATRRLAPRLYPPGERKLWYPYSCSVRTQARASKYSSTSPTARETEHGRHLRHGCSLPDFELRTAPPRRTTGSDGERGNGSTSTRRLKVVGVRRDSSVSVIRVPYLHIAETSAADALCS